MEIGPEKLIESLEKGNPEVISLPTLQYLMKVLPDAEEVRTSSQLVSNGLVNGTFFKVKKIPRWTLKICIFRGKIKQDLMWTDEI